MSRLDYKLARLENAVAATTTGSAKTEAAYKELCHYLDWYYEALPAVSVRLVLSWQADIARHIEAEESLDMYCLVASAYLDNDLVQLNDAVRTYEASALLSFHEQLLDAINAVLHSKHAFHIDPITGEKLKDARGFTLPAVRPANYPQVYRDYSEPLNASWLYFQCDTMPSMFPVDAVKRFRLYMGKRHNNRLAAIESDDVLELAKVILSLRLPPDSL